MLLMSSLKRKLISFFKPSDLPLKTRSFMEGEGLLFAAERIRVTVVYNRFMAKGRNVRHKREVVWGSLAISNKRMVGYVFRKRIIHLSFSEPHIKSVKFSCVNGKVLTMAFDPSIFNQDQSGDMEFRFHFEGAQEAYGIIRDLSKTG